MRIFIFFLFFFLCFSCVNKDKIPSGIIVRDSMPKILWDIIITDQYSKQYIVKDSAKINTREEIMKMYQQVFQFHHITRDKFETSYQFYIGRPDLMKIIYDSLFAYSNKQRTEIYKSTRPKITFKQTPATAK